jgi:hypothetical protein
MASKILRTLSIPQDADFETLYQVTLAEWQTRPTIHAGQFDDLKFENAQFRVWVSRMTLADYDGDGAAHAADRLCVEQLVDGAWLRLDRYGRLPA